jgi:hypothetical protein
MVSRLPSGISFDRRDTFWFHLRTLVTLRTHNTLFFAHIRRWDVNMLSAESSWLPMKLPQTVGAPEALRSPRRPNESTL